MARRSDGSVELDRDVCKLAHRFTQTLGVHVRRVADALGLTPAQVVALRELSEPITARELAHRMTCEPSNATFVLDRLEQLGLVQRRTHPADRRAKQILLTAQGASTRTRVLAELRTTTPLSALSAEEQQTLRELLRALVEPRE